MMFRSGGNTTAPEIRRPGNCGDLPMPEHGKLDRCTKDINELWTACFVSCENPDLYATARPQNRPYKFQCKPTGWARIDTDKDTHPLECLGNIRKSHIPRSPYNQDIYYSTVPINRYTVTRYEILP